MPIAKPPHDALTERELMIVTMLADGMSLVEISKEFNLSPNTMTSHRKHLLRKLGARTSAHAVALAYHKHILTIPGVIY